VFAQILDPVTNRIFNGSLFPFEGPDGELEWDGNLVETRINNYDLRWELFGNGSENLSISGFYKTFDNPIELVRIPVALSTNEFQPRNVGDGQVTGIEVEFGKNLGFLTEGLSKLRVNGNVTFVQSSIDMTDVEFNVRKLFEKTGETVENTRAMAGQAPYIINAGLSYVDFENGLDAGFFYNVKGSTLTVVGGGLFPDVYSVPFHSLNFNLNKSFGPEKKFDVNVGVNNILNARIQEVYRGFQAEDEIFSFFSPNRSFSVGLNYSIY